MNFKYLTEVLFSVYKYTVRTKVTFRCTVLQWHVFFLVFSNPVAAQLEPINTNSESIITKRHISLEDEMSARIFFCAVEDKDDFMWFTKFENSNEFNVDFSGLPIGNYLVKLECDEKKEVFKIIKE